MSVVAFLWGRLLVGTGAGLFAGFMSGLFPGFYFRTRVGYYDTDIATLLFPLAVSLGLAWWLNAAAASPWLKPTEGGQEPEPEPTFLPFWLGLLAAFGVWWHGDIGKFNLVAVWLGLALILALVPAGRKGTYLLGLALFALTALGGWLGALGGVALSWLWTRRPTWFAPLGRWFWPGTLLVLLVLVCTGNLIHPLEYMAAKIAAYMKPVAQGLEASGTLAYPSITQSIVEAQNIPLGDILERLMPWPWLSLAGLAGFALLVAVRPVAVFLVPLVALCLLSIKMGARMSMFGGPGVALGVGALVVWLLRWLLPDAPYRKWALILAPAVLGLALLAPWLRVYVTAPATPVLSKLHALALTRLAELSPPNSQVWTWWDWGYATDYYARRKSFADGGKHSGPRVFPLGLALITPSPLQANQVINYIAAVSKNGSDGSEALQGRTPEQAQGFFASLASTPYSFPKRNKQYLVVTWENFRLLYWISFYGSWDFQARNGGHVQCMEASPFFSLDENAGTVTPMGQAPIQVASLDVITAKGKLRKAFPGVNGPHFVYNDLRESGFFMDDAAYSSMAVQLLLADVGDARFTPYFHLIWEGFPEVRIYEVR